MTLPHPIKSVLQEPAVDAPVSRGWARIQKKRRFRNNARKGVLAVSCLALAAAVGWAVRPLFPGAMPSNAALSSGTPVVAAVVKPAPLDTLMRDLPKVQGRAQLVQRPVAPPAPAPEQVNVVATEPDADVVAALLESVRDAYDQGNTARAAVLLQEIAEKHADDPRAAQALYVLGLIQLERSKDPKAAAASFTHALELQPPAELVPQLWQALQRAKGDTSP